VAEFTHWNVPGPSDEGLDDDGASEIEAEFRRKLCGLRRLPQHARVAALKAARDERFLALKALRQKRQVARHARYLLWRQQLPAPKPPG
jgi:hypothetical protein